MGAASAAAIAATIQAVRASGVIVSVVPAVFLELVMRQDAPLIVTAMCGIFTKQHQYLMSYRGLAFYARSPQPLAFPIRAEIITAKSIWVPG